MQFKVMTTNGVLFVNASKQRIASGEWRTKDTKAKVGDEVTVENGLGVQIKATRLPVNEKPVVDIMKSIGKAIKEARSGKGMTQVQLAEVMITTKGYIAQVEQGRENITLKQLQRFAEAIGVKVFDIYME